MADTAAAVIKAVISALKVDAGVTALVESRVFTDVKQATSFPYLTVRVSSEPFASSSFSGQAHTVTLQSFSRKQTIEEALAIRKAALDALDRHEEKLELDEGTVVYCQYSGFSDAFIEDDGKTWQGVGMLEIVVV